MIRTMQLVAQLERSCVGFRSNSVIWIRKNAKSMINHIQWNSWPA
jgi:hypothetical protein